MRVPVHRARIIFLLPQALVAAELASGWSGGVFRWVSEGLSAKWGLLAVWCQFAMTIFYYPTLLGFVASTLAYVFNPDLADNGVYTGIVIVLVFWSGVFLSARGGTGGIAKLASSGLLIGTLIPGIVLVVLGIVYLLQGESSAAPMDADHVIPQWTGIASLVLIVNNFLSCQDRRPQVRRHDQGLMLAPAGAREDFEKGCRRAC